MTGTTNGTDLPARLRALADTLEGDEWEHPLDAVETCRKAAEELERLTEKQSRIHHIVEYAQEASRHLDELHRGAPVTPPTYGPCPNGCGRRTEDPEGGQCDECWREDDLDFGDDEEREIAEG